jgi:gliding motility-associated-like protein
MSKLKVFIFILFVVVSINVVAQTNIDSAGFVVNLQESYLKAYVGAEYFKDGVAYRFELDDTANYDFTWSGDLIPDPDTLNHAIYEFALEGNYQIDLSVYERATFTTHNFSRRTNIIAPLVLDVSNVFTPNGDGKNDLFKVFYDGIAMLEITIFTRTGTKVFESKSPSIIWDGRNSSGSELSEGVYYYVLKSDVIAKDQTGFIHLYRN